jgi:hypothetical protein
MMPSADILSWLALRLRGKYSRGAWPQTGAPRAMTVHRFFTSRVSPAIHPVRFLRYINPAVLCIGLMLGAADPASSTEGSADPYVSELVAQSARMHLWEQRAWLLLLHYRRDVLGGYTSQADDPGFFLAANGKKDPRAELEATLRKFFSEQPVGRSGQPAQCAFIARYHWLKEMLGFDDRRLVPLACPRFDAWLKELSPAGITLIFPSAFMNNPASMFGHTLLRIDQSGQTEQTRLLAYTINFAAEVGENRGVAFALLGVAGGFKGYFSTLPYYLKVEEYGDFENRDIWEYRLNLTRAQIIRLAEHVWEMGNAYFDYFYFKENCAYHILSMIEVANPEWHLTDRFLFWTLPSDTIRALTEQPGLIGTVAYRPSRSSIVKGRFATLSAEERRWFRRITDDISLVTSPEVKALAAARQAAVLDAVSDYLRYRSMRDPDRVDFYRERNREVLAARSDLKIASPPLRLPPSIAPPDQGHRTARAGLAAGWREHDHGKGEFFEELNLRAGYHDLLDPEQGYTPDAQIELLGVSLRHYESRNQTRLERFTLANILSLAPMNALFTAPSWKLNVGTRTIQHGDCRLCTTGFANGGVGVALESQLIRREVAFAFAEVEAEYGHAFEETHRGGGGGTVGVLAELTDRWKLLATASYLRYPFGEQSDEVRLSFGQRYTVTQNFAIRMELNRRARDNEALLTLHAYF